MNIAAAPIAISISPAQKSLLFGSSRFIGELVGAAGWVATDHCLDPTLFHHPFPLVHFQIMMAPNSAELILHDLGAFGGELLLHLGRIPAPR